MSRVPAVRAETKFPEELLLKESNRGARLIREFYEHYHEKKRRRGRYSKCGLQHEEIKAAFYRSCLETNGHDQQSLGLDVGCRGGVLIKLVGVIHWIGVDIDQEALQIARESGVPCAEMDFTAGIGFQNESFDAVMMTEVLDTCLIPQLSSAKYIEF
jgi:SAM-dependent methyltransferase